MARIFLTFILFVFIFNVNKLQGEIEYKAVIIGTEKFPDLNDKIKNLSELLNPPFDFKPESENILRDILTDDMLKIKSYLESVGFYNVRIFPKIEPVVQGPLKITIQIDLGDPYKINKIKIIVNHKEISFDQSLLSAKKNTPAINEFILNDKNTIALFFKQNGYAHVDILDEKVYVNHETFLVDIIYNFKLGHQGYFGGYKINGIEKVNPSYVEKFIRWKQGDPYNINNLIQTEKLLRDTKLFENVVITPSEPDEKKEFTININLKENKHQHLQFGVYGTLSLSQQPQSSYEIGAIPKYIHDNVFGSNETFEAELIVSNIDKNVNFLIKKPHFILFNNMADVFFSLSNISYNAYSSSGIDFGGGFEYKFTEYLSGDCRLVYEKYQLKRTMVQDQRQNEYNFLEVPINLILDTRKNKIFSDSGISLTVNWTPFVNTQPLMQKTFIKGSFYIPLIPEWLTFAGWGLYENLYGTEFDSSPMDKRVYLGGIENLRGYHEDLIGHLSDALNQPGTKVSLGGLSSVAFGLEPRFKIYGNFGASVFLEGGALSEKQNIFKEIQSIDHLYWDWGASLFYFTSFGPLRIDLAYPFGKKVDPTEKGTKFYISFGQAF